MRVLHQVHPGRQSPAIQNGQADDLTMCAIADSEGARSLVVRRQHRRIDTAGRRWRFRW